MSLTVARPPFLAGWAATERRLAGDGPDWLRSWRRECAARFDALGPPTSRLEEWKTTSVRPIVETPFLPAELRTGPLAAPLPALAELELGGPRLVFLDGHRLPALCRTPALAGPVWLGGLGQALHEIPERIAPLLLGEAPATLAAFHALNGALTEDGGVLLVGAGCAVAPPIHLVYLSTGEAPAHWASHPRTLIALEAQATATVLESYVGLGSGAYWTNAVSQVALGANAELRHYRLQHEGSAAFHVSTTGSRQERDSRYTAHNVNLGGRLVRHDIAARLAGTGADLRLNGLCHAQGEQHVDNHTLIEHASPHCASREVYKNVLDGRSRTVFNGRIVVRPGAQKTDAKQSNPNLVLSREALAHTRPQLEIYADDVKCTHGATVGRLDEDAIFYLRSRGVRSDEARALLIDAFVGELVDLVEVDALRAWLTRVLHARLPGRAAGAAG